MSLSSPNRNLVLVGGGHAHVQVIHAWPSVAPQNIKLTVVCDRQMTPYSGMMPGYLAGWYSHDDIHFDLPKMCAAVGAEFVLDRAVQIDVNRRHVRLGSGLDVAYDVASFDVGSRPRPLPLSMGAPTGEAMALKPISDFSDRWQRLLNELSHWSQTRPAQVAMAGGGASGFEVILMLARRIENLRPRPELTLWQSGRVLEGHGRRARRLALQALAKWGVRVREGVKVIGFAQGRLELELPSGDRFHEACDQLLLATPAHADPMFRTSGLPTDDAGFLKVKETLQVVGHPTVFGAGDCIAFPKSLPKSGVYAVRQGPILITNLIKALRGESHLRSYQPQRFALALITTGEKRVIASYGPWAISGEWLWRKKDQIDRGFMTRFKDVGLPQK